MPAFAPLESLFGFLVPVSAGIREVLELAMLGLMVDIALLVLVVLVLVVLVLKMLTEIGLPTSVESAVCASPAIVALIYISWLLFPQHLVLFAPQHQVVDVPVPSQGVSCALPFWSTFYAHCQQSVIS